MENRPQEGQNILDKYTLTDMNAKLTNTDITKSKPRYIRHRLPVYRHVVAYRYYLHWRLSSDPDPSIALPRS